MTKEDKLTEAYNEFEKLCKEADEKDYKPGWVFYRLKEKYGESIAIEVMPKRVSNFRYDDDGELLSSDALALKRNGMSFTDSAVEAYREEKRLGRVC